jgi:hypothetical protein
LEAKLLQMEQKRPMDDDVDVTLGGTDNVDLPVV